MSDWKSPKTIVGSVATGDYFYPRNEIVEEIWIEVEKGNYILIAAPRRVGKTSIMRELERNPNAGFQVIFKNIQSLKSSKEFYRTIYHLLLKGLNKSTKVKKWFERYIASKSITEVDINGAIKFGDVELDYVLEIESLLDDINSLEESSETILILLDELPEVLHTLNKAGKKEEAIEILKQLRTWRQSNVAKLKFVLAGSIGIHYVVNAIEGRNSDLNDLKKVQCAPFEQKEAGEYIQWATEESTVKYNSEFEGHFLAKVGPYFTPYFINILLEEVDKLARKAKSPLISEAMLDKAFDIVIKHNDHFIDWKKRLSDYLPSEDYAFVSDVLNHVAHREQISIQEIYDKAVAHGKEDDYMSFMAELAQDGYLVETDSKYTFISPLLKAFWKRNNPIYNG